MLFRPYEDGGVFLFLLNKLGGVHFDGKKYSNSI